MGADLREIREYLGISQTKMSLKLGYGGNYVGHIETEQIKNASFKNTHKICVFLVDLIYKKGLTVASIEDYLGYMPILDLLYAIELKGRTIEDLNYV